MCIYMCTTQYVTTKFTLTPLISGVAVIVSVSLAYLGVNREFELHRHQIIGVAVVAVLLFHLLLALCRPGPNNK